MKTLRLISFLILLVMMLSTFLLPGLALAQDEASPIAENIALTTEYPKLEAIATGSFEFYVKLIYMGMTDRVFDLNVTVPSGWDAYVTPQYDSKRISSITLEASITTTIKSVKVTATPPTWPLADPGEYKINLETVSEKVVNSIDLIAKITARYSLTAVPANQLYNTSAKAGQDNHLSIQVANIGTAVIDNVNFSSDKPTGWEVTFKPEKIDLMEILDPLTVDVNIKPPAKTVAGDYMITLQVSGKQAFANRMDIRVTVATPTIWGWVGVIIIVIVVIGLILIFMRFGRR